MGANDRFVSVEDGALVSLTAIAAALRPPPALTVTEWADAHRRLPSKGASEPGQWRTVELVALDGEREVYGFNGLVMGRLDESPRALRAMYPEGAGLASGGPAGGL